MTVNATSDKITLEDESEDNIYQQWTKEIMDEVDNWFTLYNEETDKYLTAYIANETIVDSKYGTH